MRSPRLRSLSGRRRFDPGSPHSRRWSSLPLRRIRLYILRAMSRIFELTRGALRLSAAALLAGCASAPAAPPAPPVEQKACPPRTIELSLSASERANPSPDGEGRPVQVRAYQLVADAKLRSASFEDIWQKDKDTLQADLVSVEQFSLFPNESKSVLIKPAPSAHYISLVALFREPQGKDWFVSFELADPGSSATCATAPLRLPIWLDRMQIQDGQGRAVAGEAQGGK